MMRAEAEDLGSNFGAECLVPAHHRLAYLEHALTMGLPEVEAQPRRKGHVAVVGTGPSVKDDMDRLATWNGPVWATNGALGLLLANGIMPAAWVSIDPMLDIAGYLKTTPAEITYYPASVCHPAVFARLADCPKVRLWHLLSDLALPRGMMQIGGGSTTATRAPMLAYALGYRRVTLFGVDSSWEDDGTFHADGRALPKTGRDGDQPIVVMVDGKPYRTSKALLSQATYLAYLKQRFPGKLHVAGRGLAPDLVRDLKSRH